MQCTKRNSKELAEAVNTTVMVLLFKDEKHNPIMEDEWMWDALPQMEELAKTSRQKDAVHFCKRFKRGCLLATTEDIVNLFKVFVPNEEKILGDCGPVWGLDHILATYEEARGTAGSDYHYWEAWQSLRDTIKNVLLKTVFRDRGIHDSSDAIYDMSLAAKNKTEVLLMWTVGRFEDRRLPGLEVLGDLITRIATHKDGGITGKDIIDLLTAYEKAVREEA